MIFHNIKDPSAKKALDNAVQLADSITTAMKQHQQHFGVSADMLANMTIVLDHLVQMQKQGGGYDEHFAGVQQAFKPVKKKWDSIITPRLQAAAPMFMAGAKRISDDLIILQAQLAIIAKDFSGPLMDRVLNGILSRLGIGY